MPIVKQNIPISMGQGLDQKSDPKQIPIGKYSVLENTIFQKGGLLQKRNGFGNLTSLPSLSGYLTTFNNDLTAIGNSLQSYSSGSKKWTDNGTIRPLTLNTLPLIRNNLNQFQCDTSISSNGFICTAYSETGTSGSSEYKFAIADSITGQNIVQPTILASCTGSPRVFFLGTYFVILYPVATSLFYISINVTNYIVGTATSFTSTLNGSFDGVVVGNNLHITWNSTSSTVRVAYLTKQFIISNNSIVSLTATASASLLSICSYGNFLYITYYQTIASVCAYMFKTDLQSYEIIAPTSLATTGTILNIATCVQNATVSVFLEIANNYGYDATIPTNFINYLTCTDLGSSFSVSSITNIVRSVGLASKAFIVNAIPYVMTVYDGKTSTLPAMQPTYFVINSSGNVVSKLAYSNGGGYLTHGLSSVNVNGTIAHVSYLYKDLISSVNKSQVNTISAPSGAAVYSQTGINLVSFDFTTTGLMSAEIGNNLNISGGFLWSYDGYAPVEHLFHLWPDSVECAWSSSGGSMGPQPDNATNTNAYYYYATYEWSDNQGNVFRSAPSIPVPLTTTGSGKTGSGSVTINVPKLRLTYKTSNPIKICIYRWSVGQQIPYLINTITNFPSALYNNNPTYADYVQYVDTFNDTSILGNAILYTNGGTVENIAPPSTNVMALFKSRLFLVDAEDQNLLWFSKQVIEATPVEMSDLFTVYVAPTTSSSSNTGPITALAALDDKLIIFKRDAIYYMTGNGPDNTGANNDFSDPIFITSTVGCSNPKSIVFMPNGLMFQSDKGIWLLGRDLSTNYIGAAVENYNQYAINSAINVPTTNHVRFSLSSGDVLMYDYYFGQWGTFFGIPAVSSCIYQGLHTFINQYGQALQETPGIYIDGSSPTLMKFTTGWINPAGLQGYIRSYFFFLLGQYFTPHKLNISIAYDYNESSTQVAVISPDNFSPAFGQPSPYGEGSPFGGAGPLEQWRVNLERQTCQAIKISLNEIFDSRYGVGAGQALTLSGINLVVGLKKAYRPIAAANQTG